MSKNPWFYIDEPEPEWQQYYPTYTFRHRDIVLKEYESASNNVSSQEKIFVNASNLLLVLATLISSLIAAYFQFKPTFSELLSLRTLFVSIALLVSFSWLTTKYFADRQKAIIFDSRKIVVLRKMLGLDYGTQQLVLPNSRLEGASNPFAIKIFPGWLTSAAYPFWILLLATLSILQFLLPPFLIGLNHFLVYEVDLVLFRSQLRSQLLTVVLCGIWTIALAYSFRRSFFDAHESFRLLCARFVSRVLRVRLLESFEYFIYRAKLAHFELLRLKIDDSILRTFLIRFEDRSFYENRGISVRGIIRAIRDYATRGRISGGSTLTQQLVRTLFIADYQKTFRRKIVEIFLALWASQNISKKDILNMYIPAVRYEKGVFGLADALRHFFPRRKIRDLSAAQAFFLAERISNVRSRLLLDRIRALVRDASAEQLLDSNDISELKDIYSGQIRENRIIVTDIIAFADWIKEPPVA